MLIPLLALAAAAKPVPAATCTPSYPAGLGAWSRGGMMEHEVEVGIAADLFATPVANVRLAVQPSRPLSGSHLATATFAVKRAGTYRIAVGGTAAPLQPLWIDVAGTDNRPLTSTAHGHGGGCNSITKVVEFALKPGRYTFLATGLTSEAQVRVLIVRK